ncbi:MAG: KH domain-containing protein [Armatimonadota bacterium]
MEELVEHLVKALVDEPDKVEIRHYEGERTIVFEIKVAGDDMGKIIGRQGRMASALRTIVNAAAMKKHKRVSLEFLDPQREQE